MTFGVGVHSRTAPPKSSEFGVKMEQLSKMRFASAPFKQRGLTVVVLLGFVLDFGQGVLNSCAEVYGVLAKTCCDQELHLCSCLVTLATSSAKRYCARRVSWNVCISGFT